MLAIEPLSRLIFLLRQVGYRRGKGVIILRSKGATTVQSYGGDFLRAYPGRTIEPRGTKDKDRSPTSNAEAYYPLYCHPSSYTKKVDKRRASRMIGQGVVLALRRTVEPRTSLQKWSAPRD
ncbi:hypothetical protein B296_00041799 [Ensete ventricosum]|uniref:Uncharacterized protein n=1 Tax=Ensete ventricosum TaxID=4639 RepID=A0A426X251_ENSVE|nr:hypothetical protein B296_00041799 [Ensete ventricosum]